MSDLLTYSAIITKVHAMKAKLLKAKDFEEIANCKNVTDALICLEKNEAYKEAFEGKSPEELHRTDIERILSAYKYKDFAKIHHFANDKQKKFLELFFMHYEVALLKRAIRACASHRNILIDFSDSKSFFKKHSHLDFDAILEADSIPEFIESLRGTYYYSVLNELSKKEDTTIFQYATAMDHLYFNRIWAAKDKYLNKTDKEVLTAALGVRTDLLNIEWIYRSKKYYSLTAATIYSVLVPIYYRLNTETIRKLVEAEGDDEFFEILKASYYGKLAERLNIDCSNIENLYEPIMTKIYTTISKAAPYSSASVSSYLFKKELEIEKVISVIESVRYGLSAEDILNNIIKINDRRSYA